MHETVLLAIVGGDEPKTLRIIEPLHFASRTHALLLDVFLSRQRNAPSPDKTVFAGPMSSPAMDLELHPATPGSLTRAQYMRPAIRGNSRDDVMPQAAFRPWPRLPLYSRVCRRWPTARVAAEWSERAEA